MCERAVVPVFFPTWSLMSPFSVNAVIGHTQLYRGEGCVCAQQLRCYGSLCRMKTTKQQLGVCV